MPAPARISLDDVVEAGRAILDAEGVDALTMRRVADAVGVRPPSLYKHVRGRHALVRLVARDVMRELGEVLDGVALGEDPRADLKAIAEAFRAFSTARPGAYALLFARLPDAWRLEPDAGADALRALFRSVDAVAPADRQLEAARTLTAWAGGFVGMELAGAFRMGGDVDAAYRYGVERITDAIAADGMRRS